MSRRRLSWRPAAEWLRAIPTEMRARRRLLGLLPAAGRPLLGCLVLAFAVSSLLPATSALIVGVLVTRLVTVLQAQPGTGLGATVPPVLALGGLLLIDQLVNAFREPLSFAAVRRINGHIRQRVRAAATEPAGIEHLERAETQNDITLASQGWPGYTTGDGAVGQISLIFRLLSAGAAAAVLAGFSVPVAVALFVLMLTLRAVLRRQFLALTEIMAARWGDIRRADYAGDVAAEPAAAKEVRVFGIGPWLVRRRQDEKLAAYRDVWRFRRRVMLRQPMVFAVTTGAGLLAFVAPTIAALNQRISAGELAASLTAALGVFAIGAMGPEALSIEYSRPALDALDRLVRRLIPDSTPPAEHAAPPGVQADRPPHVRFDGVSFTYPGTDRRVLCGLNLDVRPGEVLALVGLNGVGKTTLIKLLAGLYRPDEGRVLVDGVDLSAIDIRAWRRRLAVVFQDFIRYEFSARENVRLGAYEHDDGQPVVAALEAAAERAGALPLVRDLPAGWDTPLSRAYPGGTDLSGGQWQRIALARSLFAVRAGSRVLVLDEPTAHLDVRAELDVFNSVIGSSADTADTSVVLISHRFATVRRADRIVLLDDGRVVEDGTHDELISLRGRYADLFTIQADRFR